MIASDIKIAKIVQFGNIQYEDDSIYLDFIQDYLRYVIVVDDSIIDIFNHKIYKQLQMVDGIIPEEYVYNLGDDLYAYEVYSIVAFNVSAEYMENLKIFAEAAYEWYQKLTSNDKVIFFDQENNRSFKQKKLKHNNLSDNKVLFYPKKDEK